MSAPGWVPGGRFRAAGLSHRMQNFTEWARVPLAADRRRGMELI